MLVYPDLKAIGNYNQWSLVVGANAVVACSWPDDDATTTVSSGSNDGFRQTFTIKDPIAGTVASLALYTRFLGVGGATMGASWRLGGTDVNGATRTPGAAWTSYQDNSLPRPGAGSWVPDDLRTAEFGVLSGALFGTVPYCTTVRPIIDMEPVTGGYVLNTPGSLLLPLIGTGLILSQMPALLRAANERARRLGVGVRFMAEDAASVWRDIQGHRFPVHFDLASGG